MNRSVSPPKRRYSPEVRRSMILDQVADIVAREGVAGVSMDRICREADVSKSLVYNYFDGITELLRELLQRELRALRRKQVEATRDSTTFEEMVRNITHVYLSHINERGLIIERLQADASVTDLVDPTHYDRDVAVDHLAPIVAETFGIPIELARAATDISFGLPAMAGEYLLKSDMDQQQVEDLAVSMIIGSVSQVRNDYFTKVKKLSV